MRFIFSTLVLLLLSSTSFAQSCIPNPQVFFGFMKKLVNEVEYHGKGNTTYTPVGGETSAEDFFGRFTFHRVSNYFKMGSVRCGASECDETEERWVFKRGCMFINNSRVRFSRVTSNEIRFRYTTSEALTLNYVLRLSPGRRLDLSIDGAAPAYTSTLDFIGFGE